MKIKTKLNFTIFISILIILIVVISFNYHNGIIKHERYKRGLATDIKTTVFDIYLLTNDYLLHRENRTLHQWETRYTNGIELIAQIEPIVDSDDQKIIVIDIAKNYELLKVLFEKEIKNYEQELKLVSQGKEEELVLTMALRNKFRTKLFITSQSIVSATVSLEESILSDLVTAESRNTQSTLILLGIILIATTLMLLKVARNITKPIEQIISVNKSIARGNIKARVKLNTGDELELLGNSFNKKMDALQVKTVKLQKLAFAITNLSDMVYIADPRTLKPEYVNPAVKSIYDITQKDFLKHPNIRENRIHPEDKKRVLAHFAGLQKLKKPGRIDYRIIRKDKSIRQVTDNISWLPDNHGEIKYMVGNIRDITEDKLLQDKIYNSEKRLNSIFQATIDMMLLIDPETWKITEFNLQTQLLTGYSAVEIENMNIIQLYPREKSRDSLRILEDYALGSRKGIIELDFLTKNNEIINVEGSITQLTVNDKMYLLASFRDITEKKKAMEENKKFHKKLQLKVNELERWQKVTIDRELKMKELKTEIENLKLQRGKQHQKEDKASDKEHKSENWAV